MSQATGQGDRSIINKCESSIKSPNIYVYEAITVKLQFLVGVGRITVFLKALDSISFIIGHKMEISC